MHGVECHNMCDPSDCDSISYYKHCYMFPLMTQLCRRSCGQCLLDKDNTTYTQQQLNSLCSGHSPTGEATAATAYDSVTSAFDSTTITVTSSGVDCTDEWDVTWQCSLWADRLEQCQDNPGWMVPNCRRSCQACQEFGECIDLLHWPRDVLATLILHNNLEKGSKPFSYTHTGHTTPCDQWV